MTGIYKITNPEDKVYIGQSKDIKTRFISHKSQTIKAKSKLGDSFRKYGVESHMFELVETCDIKLLKERELFYIKEFNSDKEGLNTDFKRNEFGHSDNVKNETGRPRINPKDKVKSLTIYIEGKYLKGQNLDELRLVAYESVKKHVEHALDKNNS